MSKSYENYETQQKLLSGKQNNRANTQLFGDNESMEIIMEDLAKEVKQNNKIIPNLLKDQVLLVVKELNKKLDTNYFITKIQYDSNDTPPETVYKALTEEIIKTKFIKEKGILL
jgi:hypothetical protein